MGNVVTRISTWVSQPHVRRALLIGLGVGAAILVMVPLAVVTAGFGPAGIIAGSAAAGLQAALYGAAVPASGVFAGLTSAAMTGTLVEMAVVPAAIGALGAVRIVERSHNEN
ncbi:hypothetical protein FRC12_001968 [Ceratobasidium sp. 428]|nr:hypothetical protein FRC12_001968 [Ceratobasidium sp. 428]